MNNNCSLITTAVFKYVAISINNNKVIIDKVTFINIRSLSGQEFHRWPAATVVLVPPKSALAMECCTYLIGQHNSNVINKCDQ